ncbi:MAG: hypothetical protein RMN52_05970 [Anaerolineae bacterium]|nr:hypothetical protein [Candidatus Roseilinea sp.]MDW8449532.1 hypothetical protein [Anaerolineae bacterium]
MSKLRPTRPAQLLMAALVLISVGVLTFALRDAVREAVVIPLAYAVWLTDLLLRSLPQGLFLAVLLIISAVVLLRGLLQAGARAGEMPFRPVGGGARSRLGFWMRQLSNLDHSQFAREQTAQEMRSLMLKTLAHTHQLDQNKVMARVRSGALSVPPEIEALLRNWQGWMQVEQPGGAHTLAALWQRLRDVFPPARRTTDQAARLNDKLDAAIDYVEAQLGNST